MKLNQNNKTKLKEIFSNLFNECAWSVTRSEYNVLHIDFGDPYLKIRDRLNQKNSNDQVLIDATERRLVKPRGEWHLFVLFGDWVIITKNYTAKRNDNDLKNDDKAIDQLDGQKLLSVDYTPEQICRFEFDLGAILEIRAPADTKGGEDGNDIEWTLFHKNNASATLQIDQVLRYEKHT